MLGACALPITLVVILVQDKYKGGNIMDNIREFMDQKVNNLIEQSLIGTEVPITVADSESEAETERRINAYKSNFEEIYYVFEPACAAIRAYKSFCGMDSMSGKEVAKLLLATMAFR